MNLKSINKEEDIPKSIFNTPLGDLLKFHNIENKSSEYKNPELIIVTCMDYRIGLNIPKKFAYIIRTAGARILESEFKISFASALANIKHVAIIGHTLCGMANLSSKKETFIKGMTANVGWSNKDAESHFEVNAPKFGIQNEADFVVYQCTRLKEIYPNLSFLPLIYKVEDNKIYIIE